MKRSPRATAGNTLVITLGLALIFGLIVAAGVRGLYTWMTNRAPTILGFDDYLKAKPGAKWLVLTNCVLDLTHASFKSFASGPASKVFVAVRSPTSIRDPIQVVLATEDSSILNTIGEMRNLKSQTESENWVIKNRARILQRMDIQGTVQSRLSLDSDADKIRFNDLAPDFVVIDSGERPGLNIPIVLISCGGLMLLAVLSAGRGVPKKVAPAAPPRLPAAG